MPNRAIQRKLAHLRQKLTTHGLRAIKFSEHVGCMAVIFAALACAPAHAQIYKWVDAQGNVHFTDKKPSQNATTVDVKPPQVREPDEGELRRRALLQRAEEDFAYERNKQSEDAQDHARASSVAACKKARIEYGIAHEPMQIYRTDDDRLRPHWVSDTYQGGRRYLDAAGREQTKREAAQSINEHCDNPGNNSATLATYHQWIDEEYCSVMAVELERKQDRRSRTPREELAALTEEFSQQCS